MRSVRLDEVSRALAGVSIVAGFSIVDPVLDFRSTVRLSLILFQDFVLQMVDVYSTDCPVKQPSKQIDHACFDCTTNRTSRIVWEYGTTSFGPESSGE